MDRISAMQALVSEVETRSFPKAASTAYPTGKSGRRGVGRRELLLIGPRMMSMLMLSQCCGNESL